MRKTVLYGLGTLLLLANAYFGTYAYVVTQALLWTQTALQRGPLVMLFALVCLLIYFFLKFAKKWALNQKELITLYAMLCVGTCARRAMVLCRFSSTRSPRRSTRTMPQAAASSRTISGPMCLTWLGATRPRCAQWLLPGQHDSLDRRQSSRAGQLPCCLGAHLSSAVFWTLLCAMSLFRKQWIEEERLTFPLVLLPLEITENGGRAPIFKNPIFWAGVIIAGLLGERELHQLPLSIGAEHCPQAGDGLQRDWATASPSGLLIPSGASPSRSIRRLLALPIYSPSKSASRAGACTLVQKALIIGSAWLGLSESGGSGPTNRMPYVREQGLGAFVGIALFSLWMARKALKKAVEALEKPARRYARRADVATDGTAWEAG